MRKDNLIRLVFFGIVFMLFGCSEDLYEEKNQQTKRNYELKEVPIAELSLNSEFKKAYSKISKIGIENQISSTGRTDIENVYGFTIIDEPAKVIEYDNKTSYSLLIEKDSMQIEELKNLVIVVDSLNESSNFIVTYKLDENLENYLEVNESIIIEEIAFDPNLTYSSRLRADCIDVLVIHCTDTSNGQYCAGYDTQYGCYRRITTVCKGGSGGDGLGDSNSSGLSDVLTSPVDSNHGVGGSSQENFPDTPCGRMQKRSSEVKFKQRFKDLNKADNFKKRFETGYYEKADGSLNFMTGMDISGKRTLKFSSGTTSFMHIHMNNVPVQDDQGNPYTEYTIKMLSPADVGALIGSASNSVIGGLPPLEAYGLMLSNEGIFSISLTDTNIAMSNELKLQMDEEYRNRAIKIFKNTSANSLNRKEGLQKMLLGLLKENGFGDKVALFEAEVITEPGQVLPTINWIKKTLDTNGMLIPEPC